MSERNVVTVAVGNSYYYYLAKNLLRSFLKYNDLKIISFQILTDNISEFSEFNNINGICIINMSDLSKEEKSFTSKFRLSNYINAPYNLFIDCDCIIYKPLTPVFEKFANHSFSVIGEKKIDGEFFGDIKKIIGQFNLSYLPHFVGSVYYYTNSDICKKIFSKAEELKKIYDEIGLVRLRGKENEEPLLAIAMALYKQEPVIEDGSIKADCMHFKKCDTNILTGKLKLIPKSSYVHNNIHFDPAIIHFNDSYSEKYSYLSDAYRLKHSCYGPLIKEIFVLFAYKIPQISIKTLKVILRPIYHLIAGPSAIKTNKRIAD
jgi:hypothetical protein